MADLIGELQSYYRDFLTGDLKQLERFYSEDLVFRDPLHEIRGLPRVARYFAGTQQGLTRCEFEFDAATVADGSACLPWQMHYAHSKLNGGRDMVLRGCSLLRFDDLIHYHEDFYDVGAMVYERVPVLGSVVRVIKGRIAGAAGEE